MANDRTQIQSGTAARRRHERRAIDCLALIAIGMCVGANAAQACAARSEPGGIPCGGYEVAAIIQAPDCQFTGANPTTALGISPNGRYVCGVHGQCDTGGEAWIYDMHTGVLTTIPRPPGVAEASAEDVNDFGMVAITARLSTNVYRGFVYSLRSGVWTEFPPLPGGDWSMASGVNNAGQVCGWRGLISPGQVPQTAFIWSAAEGFQDLGLVNGASTYAIDINEFGTATGGFVLDGVPHGFLWKDGKLIDIGTIHGFENAPWAINDFDEVVGRDPFEWKGPPFFVNHGFHWKDGQMTELFPLAGFESCGVEEISNGGLAFGFSRHVPTGGFDCATIWCDGRCARSPFFLAGRQQRDRC